MKWKWLKWWQTMIVCWSNLLVYKVNFVLQVFGPIFVFFFIKYSLWSSIFQGNAEQRIGGYLLSEMLTYHLWAMVIALLGTSYNNSDLAEEIRMGQISAYLIYPFNLWEFQTARFLSFQMVQLGIAILTLSLAYLGFPQLFQHLTLATFLKGISLSIMVGWFWFTIQYLIGLLGFWLEETWTFRVMLNMVTQFLSGAMIPLDLYPAWFTAFLRYTPFPYLTFVPAKIFLGQPEAWGWAVAMLAFWIMIGALLTTWTWKQGLRLYTAAKM